jgi:hypothetical protein
VRRKDSAAEPQHLQIGGILQMKRMRRFTLPLGIIVAAVALGAAPSAVAANPEVNHFTVSESSTDNDFCGTGQTVDISTFIRFTEFLAPNQPVDYRNVAEASIVYTNPLNGATVTERFANAFSVTVISGDFPNGVYTVQRTLKGIAHLYLTDGGVLSVGAGYVVVREVWNGDQFVSREILVDRGPHPDIESGLTLFCDVVPPALGLS